MFITKLLFTGLLWATVSPFGVHFTALAELVEIAPLANDGSRGGGGLTESQLDSDGRHVVELKDKEEVQQRPGYQLIQWKQAVNAVQIELTEDIPSECHDHDYEVALNAVANLGSHFFLSATSSNKDKLDDDKCPEVLVFASIGGHKVTYLVSNEEHMNSYFQVHLLGKASLKEIVKAERNANAVDDSDYDLTKNSCIHYAGDISRGLAFDETPELAEFLIENLLMDDGLIEIARKNINLGGIRVLHNYVLSKGNFDQYVKDMVFSQLNIK